MRQVAPWYSQEAEAGDVDNFLEAFSEQTKWAVKVIDYRFASGCVETDSMATMIDEDRHQKTAWV